MGPRAFCEMHSEVVCKVSSQGVRLYHCLGRSIDQLWWEYLQLQSPSTVVNFVIVFSILNIGLASSSSRVTKV